jgi:hypothetical protein
MPSEEPDASDMAPAAYHEAGRAVAAIVLGRSFSAARIREDGSGEVEPAFRLPEQAGDELSAAERALIEGEVLQLFAGSYAEERFTGRTLTETDKLGLMSMPTADWFDVALSGRTLDSGSDMEALSERARVLVEECWEAIESVARALLASGRITRADAAWILDLHPPQPKPPAAPSGSDPDTDE